jgi:hypothetical protein
MKGLLSVGLFPPYHVPTSLSSLPDTEDHRVHRVATAAFWRTFSDEGKILAGEGGGCTPTPSHYIYSHQ